MADLVPKSFSWKTIQDCSVPIRDQSMVPCSWAFGAATLVSYQLKICNEEVLDFEASVQYLIEHCNEDLPGPLDGVVPKTRQGIIKVLQFIETCGVPLQTRFPYNGREQYRRKIKAKGPKISVRGVMTLRRNTTLADIKKILQHHPIIASIDVYESLLSPQFPKGEEDVYSANAGLKVGRSHYLVIIGYGNQNGREFYEVHNSWGREWGNKGYGRILCELVRPFAYVKEASIDV